MKWIFILLIIIVIFVSACSGNIAGPQIELNVDSYNMGDINPSEGIRTEIFTVKNTGSSLLEIKSISTSCGCTEAEVESEEIMPGEETKLTVEYDPSVHPDLVGKIKRIVYIKSNDPVNKEIELELTGNSLAVKDNEVDEHDDEEKYHDEDNLKDFEISPFEVYSKIEEKAPFKLLDVREDYEYEENHIEDTLLLSVNKLTQEELDNIGLKKDDEIVVYCRSGKRSAKAYEILTSLGYNNVKSMNGGIVHWMEEDLPIETGLTQQLNSGTSTISFDRTEHDFGEINQFDGIVNTTFLVKNNGDTTLNINSISTSCGCASAEIEHLEISPGETSTLTVFFDPDFHEEPKDKFSRTVFIETNDPANPESEVKIWVDILEGQ